MKYFRIFALVASVCQAACTVGTVTKEGTAVNGADVELYTCTKTLQTKTSSLVEPISGVTYPGSFSFNPYSATSASMTSEKVVDMGQSYLLISYGLGGEHVSIHQADYSNACRTLFNGAEISTQCNVLKAELEDAKDETVIAKNDAILQDFINKQSCADPCALVGLNCGLKEHRNLLECDDRFVDAIARQQCKKIVQTDRLRCQQEVPACRGLM